MYHQRSNRGVSVQPLLLLAILLVSLATTASTTGQPVPGLCILPGCSCARHLEDDSISTLACSDMGLTAIPDLRLFPNLTQLDLSRNKITVVRATDFDPCRSRLVLVDLNANKISTIQEGAFRSMPGLVHLLMSDNKLTEVPEEIFLGKNRFPTLDLSRNWLTDIPKGFTSVYEYITADLSGNPIGNLKQNALTGNLTKIESFDLSNLGMTSLNTLYAGFWGLAIQRMNFNGNSFPVVNQSMFNSGLERSTGLTELSMRSCGIEFIDKAAFAPINSITTLLLSGNNIPLLIRRPFELLQLNTLDLANSNISDIRKNAFSGCHVLNLYLDYNNIGIIHKREFDGLQGVELLDLSYSNIREIRGTPFAHLDALKSLLLTNNLLTDGSYERSLSEGSLSLMSLDLGGNHISSVHNMPANLYPRLHSLSLSHNDIRNLSRSNMANMSSLNSLFLGSNPLEGFPENDDTFADCSRMKLMNFDHTFLTRLPNISFLPQLVELLVSDTRLEFLPEDICCTCASLGILRASNNHLTHLPTLSCRSMNYLDFSHNQLEELHGDFLKGMKHVNTLKLGENRIGDLPWDFFSLSRDIEQLDLGGNQLTYLPYLGGMPHLIYLNASHNRIRGIYNHTFSEQVLMDELYLNGNDIAYIDPTAFPVHSDLKLLNLSRNGKLREWVMPRGGFPRMAVLYLEEMFNLHQVPHSKDLPQIRELRLTYSYHCCIFVQAFGLFVSNITTEELPIDEEGSGSIIIELPTSPPVTPHPNKVEEPGCGPPPGPLLDILSRNKHLVPIVDPVTCNWQFDDSGNITSEDLIKEPGLQQLIGFMSSRTFGNIEFIYRDTVECTPHESPLTPCQNLLDPWVLKVAIWAVWVLALLGNGMVLFIGIATREKLEPYELLICNLAFADFCMGVYLAFLAIVDVRTFGGSSFYQSALDWQLGPGCKAAGFIAIFSSELSIYTLVLLTVERVYTLSHPYGQSEKRRKRVVIFLCILGLVIATGLALLPLFDINSYDRVAVCLPYLTERFADKAYIGSILSLNLLSFLIIFFSYVYIFYTMCRSSPSTNTAQRRKDMLVAAVKIAVVIVFAFLCWAPIAVIGYFAIADKFLIDAKEAKYFIVFLYPLNACVDPFIYFVFTKRFRSKIGSIFQRSKSRVTAFPQNHHMRLQRIQNAFSSDYQMTKLSCSPTDRPEELTRLRQSRRSNSLVVQMVDTSLNTPSPTFNPPIGCNLGRRASLPPGFGSTLNMAGLKEDSNPSLPHYAIMPFRLGSLYNSSNNSSLPNLKEEELEVDTVFNADDDPSNPLTGSQESNLRRLSVVREEEELVCPGTVTPAEEGGLDSDEDLTSSVSSFEEYSDALESLPADGVTDLDEVMGLDVIHHCQPPAHLALGKASEAGDKEEVLQSDCSLKAHSCEDLYSESFGKSILEQRRHSLDHLASCRVSNIHELKSSNKNRDRAAHLHPKALLKDCTSNGCGHQSVSTVGRSGLPNSHALNSQALKAPLSNASAPHPITNNNSPALFSTTSSPLTSSSTSQSYTKTLDFRETNL